MSIIAKAELILPTLHSKLAGGTAGGSVELSVIPLPEWLWSLTSCRQITQVSLLRHYPGLA